jgi:hypothetical protein
MLEALLTSIAQRRCVCSVHGSTEGRTNEDQLNFRSYLTLGDARGGAQDA